MTQRSLFDNPPPTAEQARDAAIEQVREHAPEGWIEAAIEAVRSVAMRLECFTTDDVKQLIDDPPEPRAWGAAMMAAAKANICQATDEWRKSTSRVCHARPLRVWRSLLKG